MPAFRKVKKEAQVTKCTPEVIQKITNAMRVGMYAETASVLAGVNKDTFHRWLKNSYPTLSSQGLKNKHYKPIFAELRSAVEKAIAECEIRDLMNIDKCAMGQDWEYERYPKGDPREGQLVLNSRGNPIPKKAGRPADWTASAWRLERRHGSTWNKPDKHDHTVREAAPQVVVTLPSNGREAPSET